MLKELLLGKYTFQEDYSKLYNDEIKKSVNLDLYQDEAMSLTPANYVLIKLINTNMHNLENSSIILNLCPTPRYYYANHINFYNYDLDLYDNGNVLYVEINEKAYDNYVLTMFYRDGQIIKYKLYNKVLRRI